MELVDKLGCKVTVGDVVCSFRGEWAVIHGITKPHKPGSTGRVYVKFSGEDRDGEYFPGVFALCWKDREDRP